MMQFESQETEHDDSLTFLDCLKGVVGFNILYGVGDFLTLQNVIVEAEVRDRQLKHLIIPCRVLLKNSTCGHEQIVIWVLVESTKKLLICIQRASHLLGLILLTGLLFYKHLSIWQIFLSKAT